MVPQSLRRWFVVHFIADCLAAVPLMLAPRETLQLLGWSAVDPLATRIVAAALLGIGVESLLGRHASAESFRGMLRLKVIWSAAAVVGTVWTQLEGGPVAGWAVVAIFLSFHLLWFHYLVRLTRKATLAAYPR